MDLPLQMSLSWVDEGLLLIVVMAILVDVARHWRPQPRNWIQIPERALSLAELPMVQQHGAFLSLALKAANAGLWQWNRDTGAVIWSEENFRLLGYDSSQVQASYDNWLVAVHPQDRPWVTQAVQQGLQTGTLNIEFRVCHPDGSERWLIDVGQATYDAQGHLTGMIGIQMDVTDRKEAELALQSLNQELEARIQARTEALQNSEAFLRTVTELQGDVLCRWLPDTTLTYTNRQYRELFGLAETETRSLKWIDFLPEAERVHLQAQMPQWIQVPQRRSYEHQVVLGDGNVRWFYWVDFPVLDEQGHLVEFQSVGRDISDRKIAEAALAESHARFQAMAANIPGAILRYAQRPDGSHYIPYISPGCEALWEIPAAAIEADVARLWDFVHPEDRALLRTSIKQSYATLQPWFCEWRIQSKSGQQKWLQGIGQPRTYPDGEVIWDSLVIDITARKSAEAALRESEERLRLALQSANQGLYDLNIQTGEAVVSDEYARMLGYDPATFHETNAAWIERLHPEDRDAVAAHFQAYIHNEVPEYRVEFRQRTQDGRWQWILSLGKIVAWDAEGRPLRMLGTHTDIHDRKQAELQIQQLNMALAAQNRNLETLVEQRTAELLTFMNALPDYIYVVERATMCLSFCNDQMAQATPLKNRHALEGKTIFECFDAEVAKYFTEQNNQVFRTGETLHLQETLVLPAGRRHFDTYKIPLKHPNGEVYALVGSSRDTTELAEARQALMERTAQLEATNRELESFSYSISHDLRAPLRHIHGFVHALEQQLQPTPAWDNPSIRHYLQVIATSSHKMALLIDGLLTLARVGKRQMQCQPVPLRPLVEEALNLAQVESARQVEVTLGDLPIVLGDVTLLQQVWSNLIENAIKFSSKVEKPHLKIGCLANGTLFVQDNGIGFSMRHSDQLFGVFQRLHSQADFEGMGVGLAVVQRIIHRHGGTIWAESVPNQGATFYFTLPLAEDAKIS